MGKRTRMKRGSHTVGICLLASFLSVFPAVAVAGDWKYQSSTDRMDNAVFRFASLFSSDVVQMGFPYKPHRPELTVRTKNGRELNVLLEFSGQVQRSGIHGGEMRVKFDSGAPMPWSFGMPADHGKSGLIFIQNEQSFLARLRKAKTIMVELPYYSAGRQTFSFDVTGLDGTKLGMKGAAPPKK